MGGEKYVTGQTHVTLHKCPFLPLVAAPAAQKRRSHHAHKNRGLNMAKILLFGAFLDHFRVCNTRFSPALPHGNVPEPQTIDKTFIFTLLRCYVHMGGRLRMGGRALA